MSRYYHHSSDSDTEDELTFIRRNNTASRPTATTTVNSKHLNKCAKSLHNGISDVNNQGWTARDAHYDCVAVGATSDNRLIVSGNIKERVPSQTNNNEMNYGRFGIHEGHTDTIRQTIRSESNRYGDYHIDVIQQQRRDNGQRPEVNNARDHAEMQIVSYAQEHGLHLVSVGTSKPPCAPCKEKLEHYDIGFHQHEEGNQRPRNWETPDNIRTERLTVLPRKSVRATKNVVEGNIPESRKQASSMFKNNVKQQIVPKANCHVSASGILDTIDRIDKGGSTHAGTCNHYSGTYESDRTLRKGGYAGASLAEASANYSIFGASASMYSANAHYEYGLNNSVGANVSLARAEAHAGPVQIGTGLSLDTGASIGLDGVSASVAGFGFRVGPKMQIKTPVVDVSCNLM